MQWLAEHGNYVPEICVHLRVTHPVRQIKDIRRVIQTLIDDPSLHSAQSIAHQKKHRTRRRFRDSAGLLSPVITTTIPEAHSMPRQMLPTTYLQNACIDAIRSEVITARHSMTGSNIYGYVSRKTVSTLMTLISYCEPSSTCCSRVRRKMERKPTCR